MLASFSLTCASAASRKHEGINGVGECSLLTWACRKNAHPRPAQPTASNLAAVLVCLPANQRNRSVKKSTCGEAFRRGSTFCFGP
jgi:hypothetical protein